MNQVDGSSERHSVVRLTATAGSSRGADLAVLLLAGRPLWPTGLAMALAAMAGVGLSALASPSLGGATAAGLSICMLAIAIIDARAFMIPDELNAAALALALVNAAATADVAPFDSMALALLRGAVLAAVFLAIRVGYRWARGRDGLGLGDVKLAAVAGAWLDWTAMPLAIEIAALAALAVVLIRQVRSGRAVSRTARLPFGLYFAPAIWLTWLLQAAMLSSIAGIGA